MPIYQYQCEDCNEEFDYLVVHSDDTPTCPNCSSIKLKKQMSVFSVGSSKVNQSPCKKNESPKMKEVKPRSKEHVGCSHSYVNSLLRKYS